MDSDRPRGNLRFLGSRRLALYFKRRSYGLLWNYQCFHVAKRRDEIPRGQVGTWNSSVILSVEVKSWLIGATAKISVSWTVVPTHLAAANGH